MSTIAHRILSKMASAIGAAANEIKLEAATLADGTVIEAEAFEVGQVVFIPVEEGEALPVPAGSYELDNGMTITTDDKGVITDVKESAEEANEDAAAPSPEAAPAVEQAAKKTVERMVQEKETVFTKEQLDVEVEAAKAEAIESTKISLSKENEAETSLIKAELKAAKEKIEELETKLSQEPAVRPLSRQSASSVRKLTAEEIAKLPSHQRILYKAKH